MSFGVVHTNLSSYNIAISSVANPNTNNLPNNKSYQVGRVYGIVTTENTPTPKAFEVAGGYSGIGTIFFKYYDQSKNDVINIDEIHTLPRALPLYPQNQYAPLLNELVSIVDLPSAQSQVDSTSIQKYYITINLWNNPQQNSQPATDTDFLGTTFSQNPDIRSLIPYQGDYILGGRQGSALRFSTTTRIRESNTPNTDQNEWSSVGSESDPITILTNGLNFDPSKQYYVEQINQDLSSIYLTSAQKIPLQTDKSGLLNNLTKPQDVNIYANSSQAILNSDRIVLNSKKDEVMLFAKTNVEINTKNTINLNADTRVHLNTNSIFLGPYDPSALPQPVLLGKETIILFEHLFSSLTSLANSLAKSIGVKEGTPVLNLVNAGTELFDNLDKAYSLLENIPSRRFFVAPNNATQRNNQPSNTTTVTAIPAAITTAAVVEEEVPAEQFKDSFECEDLTKLSEKDKGLFILDVVNKVLSDGGKSKKYTDVTPLDGGTIGIAHFAVDGLEGLYTAMGDALIQKYFGAVDTRTGRIIFGRDNKGELLTVRKMSDNYSLKCRPPKDDDGKYNGYKYYNDDGRGCFSGGHNPLGINWRQGITNFVNDKANNTVQDRAIIAARSRGVNFAIGKGWKTRFEWAVAIGITNSASKIFYNTGRATNWNAEKMIQAYIDNDPSDHRRKRKRLIYENYPPCKNKPVAIVEQPTEQQMVATAIQASFVEDNNPAAPPTSPYFLGGYKIGVGKWPIDPTAHDFSDQGNAAKKIRAKTLWFNGNAWDIYAPIGTPVYSPIDGIVQSFSEGKTAISKIETGGKAYGNSIRISSGKNILYPTKFDENGNPVGPFTEEKFIYYPPKDDEKSYGKGPFTFGPQKEEVFLTHMYGVTLRAGDRVKRGDFIGYIMDMPESSADHVHIGIKYGDNIRKYILDDGKGTLVYGGNKIIFPKA